jgi:hypothetical protein
LIKCQVPNQIHLSASGRGITDYFFCFTCDEHVWDCEHLIEERLTAPPVAALDGSQLQSFVYDGRSRILEIEFRVLVDSNPNQSISSED